MAQNDFYFSNEIISQNKIKEKITYPHFKN